MRNKLELIKEQLRNFTTRLSNETLQLYTPHNQYLELKLDEISEQLNTFEVTRTKRGLVDGLGSIIKSISGNLDYTDALKYDNAIAVLRQNQNNMAAEVNHQITLSKQWVSHSSNITDKIIENQNKIMKIIDSIVDSNKTNEGELFKYIHLAQTLLILGDNIDNLSNKFSKLQDLLAFIKAKSNHHSALNYVTFHSMKNRLELLYNRKEILDISFREYFDIIRIGFYYKTNEIILVFKFPLVYPTNFSLYRLSLAPNHNNKILVPAYPYVAIHEKALLYMETECPKYSHGHLCEDNMNNHHEEQSKCIQHLILQQEIHTSCRFTSTILSSEAMEQLDDQHYIISFPNSTKVRLTCSQEQYKMLQGSYLTSIPRGCSLQASSFTISNHHDQIKGKILKILDIPLNEEKLHSVPMRTIKLSSIDLRRLHTINSKINLEEPVILNTPNIDPLYHTTIPVYVILIILGAAIVGTIYALRCRKRNKNLDGNLQHEYPPQNSRENKPACSFEMKDLAPRSPTSLSPLFSTKVTK